MDSFFYFLKLTRNFAIRSVGGPDRETLEEAATRFFKKVYIQKRKNKDI